VEFCITGEFYEHPRFEHLIVWTNNANMRSRPIDQASASREIGPPHAFDVMQNGIHFGTGSSKHLAERFPEELLVARGDWSGICPKKPKLGPSHLYAGMVGTRRSKACSSPDRG
jgi:hypothetical protein